MATTQKIRNDIAKTKEKIAEQQKRLRALEAQLAEEENLEIVRMVKAVKMDNKELTAFLKAYASGMISLPEGMMPEASTENEETEGYPRRSKNSRTPRAMRNFLILTRRRSRQLWRTQRSPMRMKCCPLRKGLPRKR